MDLIIGIAIGTAFAPFWMYLYNTWVKPTVTKLLNKGE
jgi:large-conductance mechanosensitive channel